MEIREYKVYNEEEILRLYASVGWTSYTEDPAALREGYLHSLAVLAAYEDGELLGIIRAVGDGATVVFIQDILVFPEHSRRGVGTALMRAMLEKYRGVRQIQLTTDDDPGAKAFYTSIGFRELKDIGCTGFMKY